MKLIDSVYQEYGDQIFLDDADADLLAIEELYVKTGGEFVVLVRDGEVVGSHAVRPVILDDGQPSKTLCNFKRLYLVPELRGEGWGETLMRWAIDWATDHGFERVEFWSDTRFTRAHAFFQRLGFLKDGRVRDMDDGAMPYQEYFFYMDLQKA